VKRREFLATSACVAGTVFVPSTDAAKRYCQGLKDARGRDPGACDAQGAPRWFLEAPEKAWIEIAAGDLRQDLPGFARGNRLADVRYHWPSGVKFTGGFANICNDWTGACIDQARGELLLAANGGHSSYAGNEVYCCSIRSDYPGWRRLIDPTPAEYILYNPGVNPPVAVNPFRHSDPSEVSIADYADRPNGPDSAPSMANHGRMRSVHGYARCVWAEGKIWYVGQDAYNCAAGHSCGGVWSFDRDGLGERRQPLAHNATNPWPWDLHGVVATGGNFFPGGCAAYDRISRQIYSLPQGNNPSVVVMNLRSNTVQQHSIAPLSFNGGFKYQWAAVASDLRILIAPEHASPRVWIHHIDGDSAGQNWSSQAPVNAFTHVPAALGGVYHAPSRAVIVGGPSITEGDEPSLWDGGMKLLRIPVTRDGRYDVSANLRYEAFPPVAGSVVVRVPPSYRGTYGKFNLIEDMGNGQAALVLVTDVFGPVYAFKLPVGGV